MQKKSSHGLNVFIWWRPAALLHYGDKYLISGGESFEARLNDQTQIRKTGAPSVSVATSAALRTGVAETHRSALERKTPVP
jgi:hypothetical protein